MPAFNLPAQIIGTGAVSIVANILSVPAGQTAYLTAIALDIEWDAAPTAYFVALLGLAATAVANPSSMLRAVAGSTATGADHATLTFNPPLPIPAGTPFVNLAIGTVGVAIPASIIANASIAGYTA